jgi:hypothetical protein
MTECYFTPKKDTSSATICANCGLEKMLHTIGEGVKVSKVEIITKPIVKRSKTVREEITRILYQNSSDDSECMRIKFEKIQKVIDELNRLLITTVL